MLHSRVADVGAGDRYEVREHFFYTYLAVSSLSSEGWTVLGIY